MQKEVKSYKLKSLPNNPIANAILYVKSDTDTEVSMYITDFNGVPFPLKDEATGTGGIQTISNSDGTISVLGTNNTVLNLSTSIKNIINSALQPGANISELVNDENYITLADIPSQIVDLQATPSNTNVAIENTAGTDATILAATTTYAGVLLPTDKIKLDNTTGVNSGNQTSIVGIAGTKSQFNTEVTDGDFLFVGDVDKTSIGLSNVDNTSDLSKPISTATQMALDLKANIASPTFTGTVTTPNLVVNNDATINGLTIGKGTGNVSSNTVFGYQAGSGTPTYSDSNVFIGYQAGLLNTGGRENVFIGYQAGRNYTNAGDPIENGLNVFIGSLSGLNTTTGISNTFVGQKSGVNNTTGSYNNFIGVHAAHSFTSGDHNIVFGKSFDNGTASGITGDFNVIVGDGVGGVSGAKSRNSIFGYGSGGAMTASVSNSMFGYRNGVTLSTGSNNTLLGYQSGYNITTGSNNINIGSNVTVANSNITTGSNNIIIGNDVQAASATASNQLNIGNLIFGTGLFGSGTTITGNIGIGTASPNSVLEISNPSAEVRVTSSTSTNPVRIRFSNGVSSFIGNEGSSGGSLVPGSSAYATVINTQGSAAIQFGTANTVKATISPAGNLGIGLTSPTASIHVKAGTATASTSPLKLSTGVSAQTVLEQGAVNWDGTNLFIGSTASPVNEQIAYSSSVALKANNLLTGFSAGAGTVASTDTVLQGFNKLAGNQALKADTNNSNLTGITNAVQYKLSALNTAPATSTSTGILGEIRVVSDFIYVCIATNTWVRTPLTTW